VFQSGPCSSRVPVSCSSLSLLFCSWFQVFQSLSYKSIEIHHHNTMDTDTHTRNFYRKFREYTGTREHLEHAPVTALPSNTCVVPVSLAGGRETGTRLEHAPSAQADRTTLFVSTSIESWIADQPGVFARDVQINDTAYRRLDPEYYAWLRSKMHLAKMSVDAGRLGQDQFQELRRRFNAMHEWAVEHFGESRLLDAVRSLDARDYAPPVAEPDTPRRAPQSLESPLSGALALVDEIRDRALALGWTHESLYAHGGSHRTAIGVNRGLVCFLKPSDQMGEVTTHSIEIVLPNNVRQRFYNPNVDQPWIRRVK
jgi:hypothetical protein